MTAYIFPDVLPKDGTLFPLVPLFAELVHLAPAENDLPGHGALSPLAGELLAQGLLRFHCPAPLGTDRERFFRLLDEMRRRPGDYVSLSLAGNSATESPAAIVSTVRRQRGGAADERLWQARLVLKLGEFVERQEEEIRLRLRRIALREKELLHVLRDDQSTAPLPAAAEEEMPPNSSRSSRLRLKAWQKLLACGSGPLLANIFVTADRDAFDAVMEKNNAEQQAVSLLLPAAAPAGCDVAEQRNRFRRAAAALLRGLPEAVDQEQWEVLLERQYPAAEHGRCRLSLYFVSGGPQDVFSYSGTDGQKTVIGYLERQVNP